MSKLTRYLPLYLGLSCAGVLALAALSARSQTPPSSASAAASGAASATPAASASADASASPSASGAASAGPPKNVIHGADIPTETSDAPKDKKDWEAAKVVTANSGPSSVCVFKVLREWLRIECPTRIAGALIAGEPAGVNVWSWGEPMAALNPEAVKLGATMPQVIMVMPLRRGESKVFDLDQLSEGGWDWVGPERAERISVAWRDGSPDPVILIGSAH